MVLRHLPQCLRDIYTGKDRPPTMFLPVVSPCSHRRSRAGSHLQHVHQLQLET